jgi:hypothetical protein
LNQFTTLAALAPAFFASGIFREMPGAAPRTSIGAKILGRVSGGYLVRGGGEGFSFGEVFPLPADGAF